MTEGFGLLEVAYGFSSEDDGLPDKTRPVTNSAPLRVSLRLCQSAQFMSPPRTQTVR